MSGFVERLVARIRGRNPRWPAAARAYLAANPKCFACSRPASEVHHGYPVHAYPEMEMVSADWRPVCRRCHFAVAHRGDWRTWVSLDALDLIAFRLRVSVCGPERPGVADAAG